MKLDTEFYKLPLRFDSARLAEEVLQFAEAEWRPHPQGYEGNTAIPLISVDGGMNDDVRGPMKPTPFLERCPYLQQVLASFGTIVGRARLMRIAGESDANPHVDASYYWRHHVRVHVPAVTYPEVQFICGEKAVNMAAGEAWIFDSWKLHNVVNPISTPRIHLVADTVGNAHFWENLVAKAQRPVDPNAAPAGEATFVPYIPGKPAALRLETRNFPVVMTPWEQTALAERMFEDLVEPASAEARAVISRTRTLLADWLALWTEFGDSKPGWEHFKAAMAEYDAELEKSRGRLPMVNGLNLVEALRHAIVRSAMSPELAESSMTINVAPAVTPPAETPAPPAGPLERPVFIVAAPRSGSTMLFELLSRAPGFVTIGRESHGVIEGITKLSPRNRGFDSNRLTAEDADEATITELRARFLAQFQTRDDQPGLANHRFMLEKTPKNALRIPFLRAAFPGARFIYLYREPEENISSIIEAWRSGRFVTYPALPDWSGTPWSLALIPGWRELCGHPLAEIAARQWSEINSRIMADLAEVPAADWCAISYADVVANPQAAAVRLCRFAGVEWSEEVSGSLPLSRYTLTPPEPGKWRKNEEEMKPFLAPTRDLAEKARALIGRAAEPDAEKEFPLVDLTSVHTSNLPELLAQLGISLLVTTYQAGRLIVVREQAGTLNTHFRGFQSPMGLAYDGLRLAMGTKREIWQFINQEDVARRLEPRGVHDAAFLPRSCHHTGDIRVHELAFVDAELWAVNTRFSCLCTFDQQHSFLPRWRPPFVTALSPDDRCHLNGMAVGDDAVKYVTCLGISDAPGGWRETKAKGGCLLEVPSGEIVSRELSMPHSPRVYGGHIWVLESGEGTLSRIDPATGKVQEIARLPGFTRGMDFFGPYAFIGLSQVRETAIFSGLPLTDRLSDAERTCGVWVIDLRTGSTVAFLRFEKGVQEIFAVQVLPGIRHPDVICDDEEILSSSFVVPEKSLTEVPPELLVRAAANEGASAPKPERDLSGVSDPSSVPALSATVL
jgi:uncharacterized protein (TIGR03032 family)